MINGHREAIVTLVEAGSDISLRDLQNESSLDLAERRALCHDVSASGKCDKLTVNLLKLMLPRDHAEYRCKSDTFILALILTLTLTLTHTLALIRILTLTLTLALTLAPNLNLTYSSKVFPS